MGIKEEALSRMKLLDIDGIAIDNFEQKEKITCFDWPYNKKPIPEEVLQKAKEIEEKYDITFYIATFNETMFFDMYSFLYVGSNKADWELDREELKQGNTYAWIYNVSHPDMSEIGSIQISSKNGALIRIA